METALNDIAFLANSENRLAVLETLVEAPRGRDEIRGRVDASRVTVARILRELESRGWIEGSIQEYTATPSGEWVFEAFVRLVDELEAERRLRTPIRWLPTELLTFDVRRLRDAEVVLLEGCDVTALVRRIVEFQRSGEWIRGIAREVAPVFVETQWELTVQGDARLELVVTPDALEVVRSHPPSARRFREMLDQEDVRFFVHEGIPVSVGIVDGAVGINLTDEAGVLKGGIETEDEVVHAWAVDLFETYRDRAEPVVPDLVTA